ncbi:MAG: hypothetical protein O6852_07880 [Gammaproteobacteria bacterium]|nr:hypothetical protein [Gammaproteobacteria bacterium]
MYQCKIGRQNRIPYVPVQKYCCPSTSIIAISTIRCLSGISPKAASEVFGEKNQSVKILIVEETLGLH